MDNCILQVINTGKDMTQEDMERVQGILDSDLKVKEESGMHVSMGIHNVNERIKLIYGDSYGLTILPYAEGETASTITIPCEPVNNSEKEKLLKTIMDRLN
jgi:two-component system sensor histidine kinase YesM